MIEADGLASGTQDLRPSWLRTHGQSGWPAWSPGILILIYRHLSGQSAFATHISLPSTKGGIFGVEHAVYLGCDLVMHNGAVVFAYNVDTKLLSCRLSSVNP
jgi:hypothetical protein